MESERVEVVEVEEEEEEEEEVKEAAEEEAAAVVLPAMAVAKPVQETHSQK